MSNEDQWYIRRERSVSGPFPIDVVRRLHAAGSIGMCDEASRSLGGSWSRIDECRELLVARRSRAVPGYAPGNVALTRRYVQLLRESPWLRLTAIAALSCALAAIIHAGIVFAPLPSSSVANCAAPTNPGVDWSGCRISEGEFTGANLSGARLRAAELAGATFVGAKLTRADLAYADLAGADFYQADLRGTSLIGAHLVGANLAYADLRDADLRYADLTGANLGRANLERAAFDRAIWVDGTLCRDGSSGTCAR